jgi:hypothetical protein
MGRSVQNGEPCGSSRVHQRERSRREWQLARYWNGGKPLGDEWDISPEYLERQWADEVPAVLTSFWVDLSCGCVFGALQVVPLEPLGTLP